MFNVSLQSLLQVTFGANRLVVLSAAASKRAKKISIILVCVIEKLGLPA
jgi:hypothetical protein